MRLGMMQPYLFPYIGYYKLIANTDCWCVFDIVQYTKETWMNRNRILHPSNGWRYFSVPVKKHQCNTKIVDIVSVDNDLALQHIIRHLAHYKKYAPYYQETLEIVNNAFAECQTTSLPKLNIESLKAVCSYLDIPFNYCVCSEMNFNLPIINYPGQWAVEIADVLGAEEYLNPIGGKDLFDHAAFEKRGIKLSFQAMKIFEYDCKKYSFEPNLSILDVIMWNSKERIRNFLLSQ